MSHLFCQTCGFKIEYANAKPNFCSKCGQSLNSSVASTFSKPSVEEIDDATYYDLKDDETSSQSIPHISKIQVEYSSEGHKTFTLGSLAGEPPIKGGRKTRSKSVDEFLDEKRSQKEDL
jgi:hypothetical protein